MNRNEQIKKLEYIKSLIFAKIRKTRQDKNNIDKYMLRVHEPQKVINASLMMTKRINKKR